MPGERKAVTIQSPRSRDLVALRRLFQRALRDDFQYFPPAYTDRISHQNRLRHLFVARFKSDRIILVASFQGKLIGYGMGSLTPQGNGELYWLYVDPAYRTGNIGAAILEAVLDAAHQRGGRKVTLVTYDLKDYYQRHGFRHRGKQRIHGLDLDVMEYVLSE